MTVVSVASRRGSAAIGGLVLLVSTGCRALAPETLRVDGSTGVMPLVAALAKEYQAARPNATVAFGPGMGSAARLEAVAQGTIDIALASHGIGVADIERQGLRVHKIADVPVVFAVHSSVPVTDLSETQICDIYRGAIANWQSLGGPDMAIVAVTRPKGEVDADVVNAGVPCMGTVAMHPGVVRMEKPEDMARHLAATTGAIGMTTTTVTGEAEGKVKALSLGGVAPTAANVSAGRYTLTRQSYLVTKAAVPPAVQRFLDFIRGTDGAELIKANGAIPSRS